MNGHVFECYEEQDDPNQYKDTVEALDAYVKTKLDFSVDVAPLFAAKRGVPTVELPVKVPVSGLIDTELATMLFTEEVKT